MPRGVRILAFALAPILGLLGGCSRLTPPAGEQAAGNYMESVRKQPALLLAFLRSMPKGADLHNHLSGAIYAETFIDFAAHAIGCMDPTGKLRPATAARGCDKTKKERIVTLCFDRKQGSLVTTADAPCDPVKEKSKGREHWRPAASAAYQDPSLYHDMVDAFSMRDFVSHCDFAGGGVTPATLCESAHDHFFATFAKFGPATDGRTGEMLAEAVHRAAADHLVYLELMHTADGDLARNLGKAGGWNENLAALRDQLLPAIQQEVVPSTVRQLSADEAEMHRILKCGTAEADPGCDVEVRYIYQVGRGRPPEQVFAQILLGFELAAADPRFLGVNLVMPEDFYVPMHDFGLHMRMLDYLHSVYPKAHISLHAGELAPGLVPPDGLRFHIRDSVRIGHAERIGHGVDIGYEDDREKLLEQMAEDKVLVEVCLTSNDIILGVRGAKHPLKLYLDHKVPVALATDDEGVSRSDMTQEYVRAAETYDFLRYQDLKRMARQSLEHSFLPGPSLWKETEPFRLVSTCAGDDPAKGSPSPDCQKLIDHSERAGMQWKLEGEFAEFEKKF
jgi:adenosine deaminase